MRAPLVVGYKGEIGRFVLAGLLEDLPKANDIFCVDVNNSEEDVRERIRKSDYIFLCVPLQHTAEWLLHYRRDLSEQIVVEQCSIKSFLYEDPAFVHLRFLSMHLLFRPSATPVADRRCLIFSERVEETLVQTFSSDIGRALKTQVFPVPALEQPAHIVHDRIMARHQALIHRVILVLSARLKDQENSTFVGQRIVELADRINAGDPMLYQIIQENPYLEDELRQFDCDLRSFVN